MVIPPGQLPFVAAQAPPLLGDGTVSISTAPYTLHATVNGSAPPPRWWSCPSQWEWASMTSTAALGATDLPALAATAAHVGGDPAACHPNHTLPVYTGSGVALYGRGWQRRRYSEAAAYALAHTITRHDPARGFAIPEYAYSCGGGRLLLGADSLLLFVVAPSEADLEALVATRPGAADYYKGVSPGTPVLLYVHGEHPRRDPVCVYVAGGPGGVSNRGGGGLGTASPTPAAQSTGNDSESGAGGGGVVRGPSGGTGRSSRGLSAISVVAVAAGAMLVGVAVGAGVTTARFKHPRKKERPDRSWASAIGGGVLRAGLGASGGGLDGDVSGTRLGAVSDASGSTATPSELAPPPSALDQWEPEGREDGLADIVPPESRYSVEPVSAPLPKA